MVWWSWPEAVRREAMGLLASGYGPMEVSRRTGVAKSTVYKWHHMVGGVYRPVDAIYSSRYLDRDERYEIARLCDAGHSIRGIAKLLGRAPSTVSRELLRYRDATTGHYVPERADRLAWERQRRPKESKLATSPRLRRLVQQMLDGLWSPEQVSGRLKVLFPDDRGMQISHETIYLGLYVYPRGELKRTLKADLRSGRTTRKRRGRKVSRGGIPNAVSIHDRPEEVEERLIAGHHEGDLIMGSRVSNSAVGTIVERTTGHLMLLHLPSGYGAHKVADAVTTRLTPLPDFWVKSLTWDRGTEMSQHGKITKDTGVQVYFADPHSPWQRGSNENTNGLIRQYLPKSTDLSIHTALDLQHIEDALNARPRKRLGYLTPREAFAKLLAGKLTTAQDQSGVASTP
jgi:IS30 family transposase